MHEGSFLTIYPQQRLKVSVYICCHTWESPAVSRLLFVITEVFFQCKSNDMLIRCSTMSSYAPYKSFHELNKQRNELIYILIKDFHRYN